MPAIRAQGNPWGLGKKSSSCHTLDNLAPQNSVIPITNVPAETPEVIGPDKKNLPSAITMQGKHGSCARCGILIRAGQEDLGRRFRALHSCRPVNRGQVAPECFAGLGLVPKPEHHTFPPCRRKTKPERASRKRLGQAKGCPCKFDWQKLLQFRPRKGRRHKPFACNHSQGTPCSRHIVPQQGEAVLSEKARVNITEQDQIKIE